MSYSIFDSEGYVDFLASGLGLEEVTKFIDKQKDMPKTKAFLDKGYTTEMDKVTQELNALLKRANLSWDIKEILQDLPVMLTKAKDVAIISNM